MSAGTPAAEAKVVPANTVYTATVEVSGGRGGSARSLTGSLRVDLTRPAQRGPDAPGTDPEELFAAGYAACFDSALAVAARQAGVKPGPTTVTASVSLGRPRTAGTRSPWCWTCPRRSARRPTWSARWSWPTGCVPTRTPCGQHRGGDPGRWPPLT
ncbi:OsmC family protein [Micromonospora sp. BRA006-A]|nr:OsmC family protein [Micromonospora sp. BRA006-A]